ncbi:sialin-like isoform X2 [Panonychus citri]|uniref:sialin-like isoform X2 n=1 Tax=Panonychus citri TaxID=50023 RepID=UPI002307BD91|nr:sialin-like isoform X2 [Panonychus citri]XP_053210095.1 sialin-like isoform X2 [Panonychus citri]
MIRKRSSSIDESIVIDLPPTSLPKPCIPFRYFVMFMIFSCTMIGYSVKSVINVAILAMVDNSNETSDSLVARHWLGKFRSSGQFEQSQTFNWNQYDQALVLGGYFYTFTASQLIGGVITDKSNIVILMSLTQAFAAICTLASPIAASISIYCLIAVRALTGLAHGVMLPSCFNLAEHWFPPGEISLVQSLIAVGCNSGTAITLTLTAWLCQSNLWGGWPSAFIIIGIVNLGYAVIFYLTMSNDPQSSRLTSKWEKSYLSKVVVNKVTTKKLKTPWISLFTSLPLWSIFWVRGLSGLAYYTINTKIPVYLEQILHYDITNNGLINSSFYVVIALAQLITGPLAKLIILKKWLPRTLTRKIFESFILLGLVIGLTLITYLGDKPTLAVITLIVTMFFYGFDSGGDAPMVPEMAPNLVGTAFGFANTMRCASGFIAPALIGFIIGDDIKSESKWFLTFHIISGLQIIALIIFLVFATAEPLPWATINSDTEDEEVDGETIVNAG